jgi:hypothetical protein
MKGGNGASSNLGRNYGAGGGGGTWIGDTPPTPGVFIAVGGANGGGEGGGVPGGAYRTFANIGTDTEGGGGGGGGDWLGWGFPLDRSYGFGARGGQGQIKLRYPSPQRLSTASVGSQWDGGDGYYYHEIDGTINFTTYAG